MRVSRYAPSPTGPLHLGNLRTALLAWLQARLYGAKFIMRIEDLDIPRVKAGSAKQIIDDLCWLGLDWDEGPITITARDPYCQSNRTTYYQRALDYLYSRGLVYPCFCSRNDIRQAASAPHGPMPVYPGTCRRRYENMSPHNESEIEGRKPAWRFIVNNETVSFKDMLMGEVRQNLACDVGDFVLRRSDGLFAYQLAVVVDDAAMAVTDVLRGEDLLDSTCRQIALFKALGAPAPRFWHVGLMNDKNGKRMSKRDGSDSVGALRLAGIGAQQIVGELAFSCGLVNENRPYTPADLLSFLTQRSFKSLLGGS